MSVVELPITPSVPNQRFGTTIENRSYIFDVRWNARERYWYMDVREIDETPIALGLKLVLGAFLGRAAEHPLFREGAMIAVDLTSTGTEALLDDLGTRVVVKYIPSLDLLTRIERTQH